MGAKRLLLVGLIVLGSARQARATAEICGNGVDDDGNGMVDEGCYPTLTTGVCESPLSCGDTGMVSWSTGSLHYDLPADIAPRVPWGPGIGFRRFYTSMYTPPSGGVPNNNDQPMGAHWQHTYMSWVASAGTGKLILHTSQGRDVLLTAGTTVGGVTPYTAQAGYHALTINQNATTLAVTITLLTGEVISYNGSGQLATVADIVGNAVVITEDANGGTSTVTDASGNRRLLFGYSGTTLQTVKFQLLISGTWTTEHTTTLTYTSGVLTSATIGSQLAQQYSYSSGYLTAVNDGASNNLATFSYSGTTSGRINRVDTTRGSIGFDYSSTRTSCAAGGQTLLLFNKLNATTCNTDTDCGTGGMCGGKTGTGATGACYSAARCLTLGTANGESVVTAVAAIGAGGGTCTGACADVLAYVWSTTAGLLNTLGTEDGAGRFTSALYNANGLPTQIVEGDTDGSASTVPTGARVSYVYYDGTFPGRVAEVRHASNIDTNKSSCSYTGSAGCARTLNEYPTFAPYLLHVAKNVGTTLDGSGSNAAFTYQTVYQYDTVGRVTEIDGPLSGAKTTFTYWTSSDPTLNGFLRVIARYSTSTLHLDQSVTAYDFWGHPTMSSDANHIPRCDTYDASRGFLTQTRLAMAGQADCTTTDPSDITTNWLRDSALRLTELQRPDGSCVLDAYNTSGRLYQVKRRDDCSATSAGDYQQYTYSADGLVTEVDTYNAAATVTRKKLYSYANGRQLSQIINPVNPTYYTGLIYDASGLLTEVDAENALGKTMYAYGPGNDTRVTAETRYNSATGSDTWSFLYAFDGEQASYSDEGSGSATNSVRDDMEREVQRTSPDLPAGTSTLMVYDAGGNLTTKVDEFGLTNPITSTYTYDLLARRLSATYSGLRLPDVCNSNPFTQWSYDTLPSGASCPAGATCTGLAGRLAYVTTSLVCTSTYADNSLDQQTFYSYDAAGRATTEYITDDSGRTAKHLYAYTKNSALASVTLPSTAVVGWTFGSSGSNSDTDLITGVYRTSTATPVVDTLEWYPFGPLQQYNHENMVGSAYERTRITRNLAYRTSDIRVETQGTGIEQFGAAISEDAKGRVTSRVYTGAVTGVQNSYFIYDNEDHLQCETTNSVSSCPTAGSATIKNSHYLSPPFTHAGDWQKLLRPVAGSTSMENDFTLNAGTHQIATVYQKGSHLGRTYYTYDARGNRTSDYNDTRHMTNSRRSYTYDSRGNVINERVQAYVGGAWHYIDVASAYDARNRRVYKSNYDETTLVVAQWFFYYDVADRIAEIQYIPNTSSPSTYSTFQLIWTGNRMVAYWQTDYPSATTSRRYTGTDETGRIIDMQSWPASGSAVRVWAVNPSVWGYDANQLGPVVFQPLMFSGQYQDSETAAFENNGATVHRPGLVYNYRRTYDPFTGGYLQVDPMAPDTLSSYVYVDSNPVTNDDPSGLAEECEGCHGAETIYVEGTYNQCAIEGVGCPTEPLQDGPPGGIDGPPGNPVCPYGDCGAGDPVQNSSGPYPRKDETPPKCPDKEKKDWINQCDTGANQTLAGCRESCDQIKESNDTGCGKQSNAPATQNTCYFLNYCANSVYCYKCCHEHYGGKGGGGRL